MILLIDGRSGSGKSELATAIAARVPAAQLVRLDDVYPGWHGLQAGSDLVPGIIESRRWQRWDWGSSSYKEWHELDDGPLVIEGCGALSVANRALADFGIWVEHPDADRRRRALAREPGYAPHWDDWARQEAAFIARERPQRQADATVDGADVTGGLERWCGILETGRVGR